MIRRPTFALALAAAATTAGCWSPFHDLRSGRGLEPSGSAYSRAVYGGYVELSESRSWSFDLADGEHFNLKAKAAAEGTDIDPDRPQLRDLNDAERLQLTEAHERLRQSFARGARELLPAQTARAQIGYDCWLEAAEGGRARDAMDCSVRFEVSIAELNAAMGITARARPTPAARGKRLVARTRL